ncbi:hypothetical protein CYY_003523 [Polysphondylium violaceum]|uniref:Uncharacterized protein n=1 Tax=Polysphondylium violaceum TaxID=133409 RepID=A0A8J4PWL9_9MYCE|nr:hypothetical protein CYY_003523 [Polysphondylium violaceum]
MKTPTANNNIDIYYNFVFRNKSLRSYIFDKVKDNLKIGYNYYQLPLGVIIKTKRYDYLFDRIDRYIQWKQDPSISDAYFELNEKDIVNLTKISDIIGYDRFMVLFNDFRHVFDKYISVEKILSCSDYNIFLYLSSVYPFPEKVEPITFLCKIIQYCTSVDICKYVVEHKLSSCSGGEWVSSFNIAFFYKKSLEFFKYYLGTLFGRVQQHHSHFLSIHKSCVLALLGDGTVPEDFIKEYCEIIKPHANLTALNSDIGNLNISYRLQLNTTIPESYKRFKIMYRESNIFSDIVSSISDPNRSLQCFSVAFGKPLLYKSKDCLDLALEMFSEHNLGLNDIVVVESLNHLISIGDLEGIKLLYKLFPLFSMPLRPKFTHHISLPILMFLVEDWRCIDEASFTPNSFVNCDINSLEYLAIKFPNLRPSIAMNFGDIIAKCPPALVGDLEKIHSLASMVPKLKLRVETLFEPKRLDFLQMVFANPQYFELNDNALDARPLLISKIFISQSKQLLEFALSVPVLRKHFQRHSGQYPYCNNYSEHRVQKYINCVNGQHCLGIKFANIRKLVSTTWPLLIKQQKYNTTLHYLYANGFQIRDICKVFSNLIKKGMENTNYVYLFDRIFNSKYFINDQEKKKSILFSIVFISLAHDVYPVIRDYLFAKSIFNPNAGDEQQIKCNFNYIVIDDKATTNVTNTIKTLGVQDQTFLCSIGFIDQIRNHTKKSNLHDLFDF